MQMRRLLVLVAVVVGLFWAVPDVRAAGLYEPRLTYRTVHTPRFAVHYPPGAYNMAVRVGRIAESCLVQDARALGFMPRGTIEIVLTDTLDEANGSATVLPKNTLRLYLAAPTELTGLSSYDDWLRILLTHELAHIVDIDHTAGFTRALRHVFGKVISYNGSMPQYLSEGVAVWAETTGSATGRGRSTYVDMVLRCALLDGTEVRIDQAHGLFARYPYGNASYFYGGRFHLYLSERLGEAAVRRLHTYYASQLLPMLYYPGAKAIAGASLPTLWQDFLAHERALGKEVVASLARQGLTQAACIFGHPGDMAGSRYDRKGRILYARRSPIDGATVRIFDPHAAGRGRDRLLFRDTYSNRFALDQHGEDFVYTMASIRHRFDSWGDLYLYDAARKKRIRLYDRKHPNKSLRAREPTLSHDGRRLIFVQTEMQQSWLTEATLERDAQGRICPAMTLRPLVPPSGDTQHASPAISPDDALVADSVWFAGGNRDVVLLDGHTGVLRRRLTKDTAQDGNPTWSPDGRYVLWESDNDGISNIYAFDVRAERYYRVTRVWGGAFAPDVSADGKRLLFRHARGGGFEIKEMPFAPTTWEPLSYSPEKGFAPLEPTPALPPATSSDPTSGQVAASPDQLTAQVAASSDGSSVHVAASPKSISAQAAALSDLASAQAASVPGQGRQIQPAASNDVPAIRPLAESCDPPAWQYAPLPAPQRRCDEPALALDANEREGPYAPLRTLLPFRDNWLLYPSAYVLNNDPGITLQTLGQDSLQYHSWQLTAGTTLRAHRPNVQLGYVNNRFLPTYAATLTQQTTPFSTARGWGFQTVRQLQLGASWPFVRRHQVALGYSLEHRRNDARLRQLLPAGRFGQLRLSYSFAFVRSFPYSIGPEIGRALNLSAAYYGKALGGSRDQWVLGADVRGFVNNPLFANHVLAMRLRGSYALGRENVQSYFLYGTQGSSVLSVQSSSLLALRGFGPRRGVGAPTPGAAVVAAYAEYRAPLWHIQRGIYTWPIYFEHLHAALFADAGNTFGRQYASRAGSLTLRRALQQLYVSMGAELRLDFTLAWQVPLTLRVGVARPVLRRGMRAIDNGAAQVYFDVGTLL